MCVDIYSMCGINLLIFQFGQQFIYTHLLLSLYKSICHRCTYQFMFRIHIGSKDL